MSHPKYVIYKHTSPSGKSYIGQTQNLQQRNSSHRIPSSNCTVFRNAIQKYGWENFQHEILAENLTLDEANILEEQYITEYNTISPNGYNLRSGGLNHKFSDESRQKMSSVRKGKPRTPEHQQKLNDAARNRIRSPEHQAKLLEAVSKPKTEKHKSNISKSKQGIPKTEEHKQKISQSLSGRTQTSEHIYNSNKCKLGRRIHVDPITEQRKYIYPDTTIFPSDN